MINYQPKNNYVLSQDILQYLTISSAILNYQPKFTLNDYFTVSNANILFNSNITISSSINSLNQYSVCPRLRTILEIEQTRDPLISYRKITWNPLISLEKILAFFSTEIMGSPNILLGIPLIKKYNRETHNI